MVGIITVGWDPKEGGQVYSVFVWGYDGKAVLCHRGSGSSYLCGHVNTTYWEDMNKEECQQFISMLSLWGWGGSAPVVG